MRAPIVAILAIGVAACGSGGSGFERLRGGASGRPSAAMAFGPAALDAAVQDFRELLSEVVATDTTNPPGNEARAVAIFARRLRAEGIAVEVSEFAPGRENLVARLPGSGDAEPLLLLAHSDVVGAAGQQWSSDPHVVTERDGFLVGRGVSDDLGPAVVIYQTLVLLRRSGVPLRRDVVFALTGDEESGGDGVNALLVKRPQSIRAAVALNEGGGIVLGDDGRPKFAQVQAAEKTYQDFEIVARGPTGHSSVPVAGNAIDRLARALGKIASRPFPVRLLPLTAAWFEARAAVEPREVATALRAAVKASKAKSAIPKAALQTLEKDPVLAASLRTTCVATTLSGGTRVNALPAEARANVNCRILPDETVEDVRRALAERIDDVDVEVIASKDFGSGPPSPLDGEALAAIRRVVEATYPGTPVIPYLSLGATDSRFLRRAGTLAYGFSTIAMTLPDARRAHGVDERIPIASIRPAIDLLYRLLLDLAEAR